MRVMARREAAQRRQGIPSGGAGQPALARRSLSSRRPSAPASAAPVLPVAAVAAMILAVTILLAPSPAWAQSPQPALAARSSAAVAAAGSRGGELILTVGGRRVGSETYAIEQLIDGWRWQARTSLNFPQTAELVFDAHNRLRTYRDTLQPPGSVAIIHAQAAEGRIAVQIRRGATLAQARAAAPEATSGNLPAGWWLLPDNMFSLYGRLTRLYSAANGEWQMLGAAWPSLVFQLRRLPGDISVAHDGRRVSLSVWQLRLRTPGGGQLFTFCLGPKETLVWLDLPQQNFQARLRTWPPASFVKIAAWAQAHAAGHAGASAAKLEAKLLAGVRQIPVSIPTPSGALAGDLTEPPILPAGAKLPAAVIIAGSGPTDRNGNNPLEQFQRFTYLRLAAYLSRHGVIVLRYDKRGIAASAGVPRDIRQYARDVGSAVKFLLRQPGVDPRRVTLVGHSEGSSLAFWDAARDRHVAAIVSLEGAGRKLSQVVDWQFARALRRVPPARAAQARAELRRDEAVVARIAAGKHVPPAMLHGNLTLASLAAQPRFARSFLNLNPLRYVRRDRVPTLVVQGGKDIQVTRALDAQPLYDAIPANVPRRLVVFPNMIHLLYDVSGPAGPANYLASAATPLDKGMQRAVLHWVIGSRAASALRH
jgi:fermentation-respiration switch protein FrsA (DUF1100 family)